MAVNDIIVRRATAGSKLVTLYLPLKLASKRDTSSAPPSIVEFSIYRTS